MACTPAGYCTAPGVISSPRSHPSRNRRGAVCRSTISAVAALPASLPSYRIAPGFSPGPAGGCLRLGRVPEPGTRRAPLSGVRAAASGTPAADRAPANVLITGSTKGVGRALAEEFLRRGDTVLVTSRADDRVQSTVEELRSKYGATRVYGTPCNVSDGASVAALAEFAKDSMGRVDAWINNAGTNAYFYGPITECRVEDLEEIVQTNLLGLMLCCRQAILLMKDQPKGGHIFNMDGAGADGNPTPRFAAYGATKRSLAQLTKSLQAELKMLKISNVTVHNLSPGMVTTELLMAGANTPQAKFFINALAEPAEDVAEFLVPRVQDVISSPSPQPSYIKFLTRQKALSQIFQRLLLQKRKDRYVPE